ncbi:MAG: hypothetical protein LIR46_09275 [Bacteroidota bacterium]|nr:hypothetical protein [Bacteroidota bacterium]
MMTDIFTTIGVVTTGLLFSLIVTLVVGFISDAIREAAWVHKYRHRFDKPPTAACYCIDCTFHGDAIDPIRCTNHEDIILHTADEWFCHAAEPKAKEVSYGYSRDDCNFYNGCDRC